MKCIKERFTKKEKKTKKISLWRTPTHPLVKLKILFLLVFHGKRVKLLQKNV